MCVYVCVCVSVQRVLREDSASTALNDAHVSTTRRVTLSPAGVTVPPAGLALSVNTVSSLSRLLSGQCRLNQYIANWLGMFDTQTKFKMSTAKSIK